MLNGAPVNQLITSNWGNHPVRHISAIHELMIFVARFHGLYNPTAISGLFPSFMNQRQGVERVEGKERTMWLNHSFTINHS